MLFIKQSHNVTEHEIENVDDNDNFPVKFTNTAALCHEITKFICLKLHKTMTIEVEQNKCMCSVDILYTIYLVRSFKGICMQIVFINSGYVSTHELPILARPEAWRRARMVGHSHLEISC